MSSRDYHSDRRDGINSRLRENIQRQTEDRRAQDFRHDQQRRSDRTRDSQDNDRRQERLSSHGVVRSLPQSTLPTTQPSPSPSTSGTQVKTTSWDDPLRHFVPEYKPRRQKYNAPPNRYGISPDEEHWDGVDRSNGFEAKLLRGQAAKIAKADSAHNNYLHTL